VQNADPSWLMYAASLSRALPPLALLAKRTGPIPGRSWAATACLLLIVGDYAARTVGARGINNLWVGYVSNPAVGIATLLALASWQRSANAKRFYWALAPVFALAWIAIVFLAEDLDSFSVLAFPVQALLLLILSLWTLLSNGLAEGTGALFSADWFWIAGGFALSNGAASAIEPLSAMLLDSAPERLFQLFNFKAGIDLVAALAITAGMLCPVTTAPSSPSSSPPR
jgi:hypothetical protein